MLLADFCPRFPILASPPPDEYYCRRPAGMEMASRLRYISS